MKFCPECGTKLADGVKFCTECGAKLAAPAPAPVYEAPAPTPVYEAPAPTPVYEAPAPASVYEAPAPEPVCEVPAPASIYEAPAPEPVYEAPAAPAYEPPVQQKEEPPVQRYTPPPAPPKAEKPAKAPKATNEPKTPGEKKPVDIKKLLPIIIGAAVVLILLIVLLSGGKNQGAETDWGRYEGVSCVVSGMDLGAEGEWIELKKKGKAALCIMGTEYSGKWTLDGENIVVKQGGDEFPGTLKNGTLEIDMAGMLYTFQKEGTAAVPGNNGGAKLPGKGDKESAKADGSVTYKLVSASADGEEIPAEILEMMGGGYIVFNGDGTGIFAMLGENFPITYDGGNIMADGQKMAYTLTDKGLEFAMEDGSGFVLEVTDETPDLTAPTEPEDGDGSIAEPAGGIEAWAGDYYGYWVIDSVWSNVSDWVEEGAYWDACASLELDADGTGMLTIWDGDFTKDMPLAQVGITATENGGVGRFVCEDGFFLGESLAHADWLWYTDATEYGDVFVISGQFDDGEDDFWYEIYLRPWGTDWSDVEANGEPIPPCHYDWYLPMVESGVTEAPATNVGQ